MHDAVRMNAGYERADVKLSGGLDVEARFDLRNTSAEPWQPRQGFAAGYHIFDAETGTLM